MMASEQASIDRHTALGWWGDDTLDAHFLRNVPAHPNRLAITDPPDRRALIGTDPQSLTYGELNDRVNVQVAALREAGVRREDIVVFQLPNVHEIVVILLACARMGAIASPVVMQYDRAELSEIFSQLNPAVYITVQRFKKRDMAASFRSLCAEHNVTLLGIDDLPIESTSQTRSPDDERRSATASNEVLTICWTSGTEGQAKGVLRSHNLWLSIGRMVGWGARLQDGDVILNVRPMVNMAAIGGGFYSWLLAAGTLVLQHPLDMTLVVDQIRERRVTVTFMPPAFIVALLKDPALRSRADLSSLRVMGSGSAALPEWATLEMASQFGVEIVNFFGSNEGVTLQSTAATVPDTQLRATHFARMGREDIAWPDFDYAGQLETKLVDTETQEEITEPGRAGELLIRGSTIFSYYYRAPEQTKEAFDDAGFYRSGDLFEIEGDGNSLCYYKFVGRCRELIIRGGFNIAPAEIDNLLSDHPAINEVAAFGVADDRLGERIGVAVVLREAAQVTLDEVVRHLKSKHIANFKLPEGMVAVESLPRNPMQKVLRQALSARYALVPGTALLKEVASE